MSRGKPRFLHYLTTLFQLRRFECMAKILKTRAESGKKNELHLNWQDSKHCTLIRAQSFKKCRIKQSQHHSLQFLKLCSCFWSTSVSYFTRVAVIKIASEKVQIFRMQNFRAVYLMVLVPFQRLTFSCPPQAVDNWVYKRYENMSTASKTDDGTHVFLYRVE